jgi:hypothetical protein
MNAVGMINGLAKLKLFAPTDEVDLFLETVVAKESLE